MFYKKKDIYSQWKKFKDFLHVCTVALLSRGHKFNPLHYYHLRRGVFRENTQKYTIKINVQDKNQVPFKHVKKKLSYTKNLKTFLQICKREYAQLWLSEDDVKKVKWVYVSLQVIAGNGHGVDPCCWVSVLCNSRSHWTLLCGQVHSHPERKEKTPLFQHFYSQNV